MSDRLTPEELADIGLIADAIAPAIAEAIQQRDFSKDLWIAVYSRMRTPGSNSHELARTAADEAVNEFNRKFK